TYDTKKKSFNTCPLAILMHNFDVLPYALPGDPKAEATNKEWDPCDVKAYFDALKGYNVVAVFYGHTHARNVFRWDGSATKAERGLAVFNADKCAHFNFTAHAFFHVRLTEKELTVREYRSADRWKTGAWTPQVWTAPVGAP